MRLKILTFIITFTLLLTAACQGGIQNGEYIVEVTRLVTVVVTATPEPDAESTLVSAQTIPTQSEPSPQADTPTTEPTATDAPTIEPIPEPTLAETPIAFPTPMTGRFFIAEQPFENGRMFWLEPIDQIWVILIEDDGSRVWQVYEDAFEDGMLEQDTSLAPPDGLQQPIRGFGLLWRETDNLRQRLGWAVGDEIGYNADYQYNFGGEVNEDNEFIQGDGYHQLITSDDTIYQFIEGELTWLAISPIEGAATEEPNG